MMKALIGFVVVFMVCLASDGMADEKHIALATFEYPPYYGEQLENYGFIAEIITEAYARMNYDVDITFYPWPRAVEYAKEGEKANGIFTFGTVTEERLQLFVYADPLPPLVYGFYKRVEDQIAFTTYEALRPYRIGVVRGYVYGAGFEAARSTLKIDEVTTDELNVRKLELGRIDLMLIDKYNASYLIRTKYPEFVEKIEWIEPLIKEEPQYLAISKKAPDSQQKVDDFNRGLKLIQEDGTIEKILAKHGFLK